MRRPLAPSATRTAISPRRAAALAISRFATLTHAIVRTNATAASSTSSADFIGPTRLSASGSSGKRMLRLERGYACSSLAATASISACAAARVTPGFRRTKPRSVCAPRESASNVASG